MPEYKHTHIREAYTPAIPIAIGCRNEILKKLVTYTPAAEGDVVGKI